MVLVNFETSQVEFRTLKYLTYNEQMFFFIQICRKLGLKRQPFNYCYENCNGEDKTRC